MIGFQPDGVDAYTTFTGWAGLSISLSVTLMAAINFLILLRHLKARRSTYETIDDVIAAPFFYITLACYATALVLPLIYAAVNYAAMLRIKWLVMTLLIANTLYWIIASAQLLAFRLQPQVPPLIIAFHSLYLILELMPLFLAAGNFGFPSISVNNAYGKFYFAHILFVLVAYIALARSLTTPVATTSGYGTFVDRSSKITKYMWPTGQLLVRVSIVICLLLVVAGRLINVAVPLYSKWIVDSLTSTTPVFRWDLILVGSILKFLQGGGAMGGFLNSIRSVLWLYVQQHTTLTIDVDVFAHLQRLPLKWHLSRKSGEVLKIIDRGTSSINDFLKCAFATKMWILKAGICSYFFFTLAPTIIDIVVAVIFFVSAFNIAFGGLILVAMTAYLSITIILTRWRIKFRREMNAADNASGAVAMDSLLNYETVKYYGNEHLEAGRYRKALADYQKKERKSVYSLQLLNGVQNIILGVTTTLGSLGVAYLITRQDSTLSTGDYVLFTSYLAQLSAPLNFLGSIYSVLQRAFIDMENLFQLLQQPREDEDDGVLELTDDHGSIVFSNVSFSYSPEVPILRDLSFTIPAGHTVALVGPSGSGKSTTIRLLYRLYNLDSGNITIGDKDYRTLQLRSLRRWFGVVPQESVLFNETLKYNINYGRPSASNEEVEEAARAADLHDFIQSHPQGYECVVGERGLKLSGGEKQRVAIARTMLKNPGYVLLDEATSSLDARTERFVQDSLRKLCRGKTTFVVAHRLSTIVNANTILVMDHGTIVERGSHAELLALDGVYASLWRMQSEGAVDVDSPASDDEEGSDRVQHANGSVTVAVLPHGHQA